MKITSPIAGHTGVTHLGPTPLSFEDGVAEVDELTDGQRQYLLGAGYRVGNTAGVEPEPTPEPADPRDHDVEQVGTPLRDAAVDPRPGDFLAPTNAGKANPHGPDVVSPGIHANEGVRPVKGGDVHVDDTDAQDDAETEHAETSTDGTPVTDGVEAPAGNASREAWADYVTATGGDPGKLTRDELRDKFGPQA